MLNPYLKKVLLTSAAILCTAGCGTDLVLLYVFGRQIPGYCQLTSSISKLGVSSSPVAGTVMVWSVILGFIFVLFALAYREAYAEHGKNSRKVSWLLITYGLGEGVASGVFKADLVNGTLTRLAIVHDILGGIGIVALLLLPLLMRKMFPKVSSPAFYRFSGIILFTGLLSIVLFSFRLDYFQNTFLNTYSGTWQRTFLIDYYLYFSVLSFMMIRKIHKNYCTVNNCQ